MRGESQCTNEDHGCRVESIWKVGTTRQNRRSRLLNSLIRLMSTLEKILKSGANCASWVNIEFVISISEAARVREETFLRHEMMIARAVSRPRAANLRTTAQGVQQCQNSFGTLRLRCSRPGLPAAFPAGLSRPIIKNFRWPEGGPALDGR